MNQWMGQLTDDLSVAQLSIPGTHNSAAFKAEKSLSKYFTVGVWKCQQWDIEQQLDNGVRYFDLRIRYAKSQQTGQVQLHLQHIQYYLGQFKQAIMAFKQFLTKNPTEFLILQIQQQYSNHDHHLFGQEVENYLLQSQLPVIDYPKCKKFIPKVMQLRGKVWLIEAAKVQMGQFHINTRVPEVIHSKNYILQNIWQKATERVKMQAINAIMAYENGKDKLKINYLSFSSWTEILPGKKRFQQ